MQQLLFTSVLIFYGLTANLAWAQDGAQRSVATMTTHDLVDLCAKHSTQLAKFRELSITDQAERKELSERFSRYWSQAAKEMHDIFSAQPSTEAGKMAMIWVIINTDADSESHVRAAEHLMAYHGPGAVAGEGAHLDGFHPIYEIALRKVCSSNSNHATKADSLFHLAGLLVERSRYRELMDATPEVTAERVKNLGVVTVAYLDSTKPKRDREEAKTIYHQLISENDQVPYRNETFSKASEKLLIPLEQSYPDIGKPAPEIKGRYLNGDVARLTELRGKVVVLAFWASWCGPCLGRIPEENKLVEKFASKPFELIGICGDESKTDALKSVDQHGIRFRSIWNLSTEGATATELFGVEHWPSTFVLDRTGVIGYRDLTGVDLEEAVTLLLNEKAPKSEQ